MGLFVRFVCCRLRPLARGLGAAALRAKGEGGLLRCSWVAEALLTALKRGWIVASGWAAS